MRDSNVANAAKESAQAGFPHGLLDFRTRRAGLESRANWCSLNGFASGSVRDHSSAYHTHHSSRTAASRAGSSGWLVISARGANMRASR
jgi:hypothetical protein